MAAITDPSLERKSPEIQVTRNSRHESKSAETPDTKGSHPKFKSPEIPATKASQLKLPPQAFQKITSCTSSHPLIAQGQAKPESD